MKLATLKDGTRDGTLLVVAKDLKRALKADHIAPTLQPDFKQEPLMYQGCSDPLLGPCDDIAVSDEAHGIDLEMELGVITGDVPMGVNKDRAGHQIRLLVLLNDVSLRSLAAAERAKGFGFFHSKPPSSFAPVAITPEELGEAWDGRRAHGPVRGGNPAGRQGDDAVPEIRRPGPHRDARCRRPVGVRRHRSDRRAGAVSPQ